MPLYKWLLFTLLLEVRAPLILDLYLVFNASSLNCSAVFITELYDVLKLLFLLAGLLLVLIFAIKVFARLVPYPF